jgi:hypothetical protein
VVAKNGHGQEHDGFGRAIQGTRQIGVILYAKKASLRYLGVDRPRPGQCERRTVVLAAATGSFALALARDGFHGRRDPINACELWEQMNIWGRGQPLTYDLGGYGEGCHALLGLSLLSGPPRALNGPRAGRPADQYLGS